MAKFKIPQSESTVKIGAATQTGLLALPMSLATTAGAGWGAVGKVIDDIHKEQVAIEDNNDFLEIVKVAAVDIEKISSSVSKNSSVKFAVETFDNLTTPETWNSLTIDKRPNVKKLFNQWLNKTKTSEYVSIARTVTGNHVKRTKLLNNNHLDALTLKMAHTNSERATNAENELNAWFDNLTNSTPYTLEEFEKLKQDKLKQADQYKYQFGAKNNPDFTIKNRKAIEKIIGPEKTAEVVEIALQKIASDADFNIKQERLDERFKQDNKIATFAELLLRIQQDDDPEYLGKLPTLDLLNDLWKANKINTAQYDALLKFYADPKGLVGSDDVYDLITSQIYISDNVDERDQIHRTLNLTPEYLMSLGIKDVTAITGILEKSKNRQVFQDMKFYKNILDDILGKLDKGIFVGLSSSDDLGRDKKLRTKAERLYNEYLNEGLQPEDAFKNVAKGFLLQQNKLPTIFDTATITSIPTLVTEDTRKLNPTEVFNGWRSDVMEQYKLGNIGFEELKRDIDSLDVMQDVFKIRQAAAAHIKDLDPWGASNATGTSGTGAT